MLRIDWNSILNLTKLYREDESKNCIWSDIFKQRSSRVVLSKIEIIVQFLKPV